VNLRRQYDADIVVVGLGAIGSSTLWRLAERGISVIGLEQFSPGHDRGSSHGNSRLFRVACLEHPNLVTMARRSRDLWRDLEALSGESLLKVTGSVTIGEPSTAAIRGALAAAEVHSLDVELLTSAEVRERLPQHAGIPNDHIGVCDPEAGILRPEAAIVAAVEAAQGAGAQVVPKSPVAGIERVDDGVIVTTATTSFTARQVVLTAGAWLGNLVPDLPVRSRRVMQSWFAPKQPDDPSFSLDNLPVFIRVNDEATSYWGHGDFDGGGTKIGIDWDPNARWTAPDQLDRNVHQVDFQLVSDVVASGLPGLDPNPLRVLPCMVTYTPDHQFFVGRPKDDQRLIVGGGGSGHAFKHAAGIGEAIAQIASGEEPFLDTGFVSPTRPMGSVIDDLRPHVA